MFDQTNAPQGISPEFIRANVHDVLKLTKFFYFTKHLEVGFGKQNHCRPRTDSARIELDAQTSTAESIPAILGHEVGHVVFEESRRQLVSAPLVLELNSLSLINKDPLFAVSSYHLNEFNIETKMKIETKQAESTRASEMSRLGGKTWGYWIFKAYMELFCDLYSVATFGDASIHVTAVQNIDPLSNLRNYSIKPNLEVEFEILNVIAAQMKLSKKVPYHYFLFPTGRRIASRIVKESNAEKRGLILRVVFESMMNQLERELVDARQKGFELDLFELNARTSAKLNKALDEI